MICKQKVSCLMAKLFNATVLEETNIDNRMFNHCYVLNCGTAKNVVRTTKAQLLNVQNGLLADFEL